MEKFSILLPQVFTLLGIESGNALAIKINNVNDKIPAPIIYPIYFMGYPPIKAKIKIIEKIIAVVEKLAGKINIRIKATGSHSSIKLSLKTIFRSLFLAKYLEV